MFHHHHDLVENARGLKRRLAGADWPPSASLISGALPRPASSMAISCVIPAVGRVWPFFAYLLPLGGLRGGCGRFHRLDLEGGIPSGSEKGERFPERERARERESERFILPACLLCFAGRSAVPKSNGPAYISRVHLHTTIPHVHHHIAISIQNSATPRSRLVFCFFFLLLLLPLKACSI